MKTVEVCKHERNVKTERWKDINMEEVVKEKKKKKDERKKKEKKAKGKEWKLGERK